MRALRSLAAIAVAIVAAVSIASASPAAAAPLQPAGQTVSPADIGPKLVPHFAWYAEGVVITFDRWDTGLIGATASFTAVWVASATLTGQDANKLYQAVWYIQAMAAYDGAIGKCLWVWVPKDGDGVSAGNYNC